MPFRFICDTAITTGLKAGSSILGRDSLSLAASSRLKNEALEQALP